VLAAAAAASCSTDSSGTPPGSATGGQSTGGQQGTTGGISATGGSPNSGSGGGAPRRCNDVAACGGDVVGEWVVKSSCLEFTGEMDVSLSSLGCKTVQITGSLTTTGGLITKADGTFVDNTKTTGSASFPLPAACLEHLPGHRLDPELVLGRRYRLQLPTHGGS
jgi:hypothetical protein